MIIINDKLSISFTYTLSKKGERKTVCDIFDVYDKVVVSTGIARCNKEDNFSKEEGRKISLRKALECMPYSVRTMAWKAYFNRNRKPSAIGKQIVDKLNELFQADPSAALALSNLDVDISGKGVESKFSLSKHTDPNARVSLSVMSFLDSLLPDDEWIATTWDDKSSTDINDFLGFTIINPDHFLDDEPESMPFPPTANLGDYNFAG